MPYLNMSGHQVEEKIKALHDNLDHALSCLSVLQQPMMSTSRITKEEEAEGHAQMHAEMFEAIEQIIESCYGGQNGEGNGSAFVFKV